jgi:cysteine desulfuration protein SufE
MNAASTLADRQATVVARMQALPDWKARYRAIIETGRALPPYPDEHRTEKLKIKGCQSQVWLHATLDGDRMQLQADSDAEIVRGLVALVVEIFEGATPDEILTARIDFVDELGLSKNLSVTRANGLMAMIRQIQLYATVFRALAR